MVWMKTNKTWDDQGMGTTEGAGCYHFLCLKKMTYISKTFSSTNSPPSRIRSLLIILIIEEINSNMGVRVNIPSSLGSKEPCPPDLDAMIIF